MLLYKKLLILLVSFAYFVIPPYVFAADTCCAGHGGDYACNFSTHQLYCKDRSVSAQCTCNAAPTPTPTLTPTTVPTVTPTPPSCPSNATYAASKNACMCKAGYVVNNTICVSYSQYCRTHYGNNAVYTSASNACGCSQGYTWNADGSTCISMDALCHEKLGKKSYYNSSDNKCYCYQGYAIKNSTCQVLPTPLPPPATVAPTEGVQIVTPTSAPVPTIAAVAIPTSTPTPAPTKKIEPTINLHKKAPEYIAVKKKHNGFFVDLFSTIWHAILKAFNIY